jgi:hypothetical protein
MGLSAHVFCNCLKEQKTTLPPMCRELIYIDDDGFINMRYPDGVTDNEQDDLWHELSLWAENCCSHPDMHFCSEHVGNWSSVRELQQAVCDKEVSYPSLASIFPYANGGQVSVETARLCLKELELFCHNIAKQAGLFLVNAKTDRVIYSYIESYGGIFFMDGITGIDVGFDYNGLFVIERKSGKEHFRSLRFLQEALPDEYKVSNGGKKHTIHPSMLTDTASGNKFKVDFTLDNEKHSEFQIVSRSLTADDFYSIEPLKKLFSASIETGNSIYWS